MVFTPKGLHNKAQGRERSERTLGGTVARLAIGGGTVRWHTMVRSWPRPLRSRPWAMLCNPFGVESRNVSTFIQRYWA
jgi:hypothetical protein